MPASVPVLLAQAANLVDGGQFDAAEEMCHRLLTEGTDHAHALHILGVAARKRGRFEHAVELFTRSLEIRPNNAGVAFECGVALVELRRLEEALEHFRRAVEWNPEFQEACVNVCTILERLDRVEEALPWAHRAVQLKSDCGIAHFNLGNLLQSVGRVHEAIDEFEAAARHKPGFENARWNCSLAHLLVGNFSDGWRLYESRDAAGKVAIDRYAQPRWNGEPLQDKTILVHAEQGIGDEILFASCLPDLLASAGKVVIVCEPRLAPLFARSFPQAAVHGVARRKNRAPADAPHHVDYQIPAGSVPGFLRKNRAAFGHRWRFLVADQEQHEAWRARFDNLGAGLKIGISWRAGGQPTERRKRTTALDQWLPIFGTPGAHFINLQYGDTADEIADARERLGVTIHDFAAADPLLDMDAFAAKLSALDLVISVGNATVHLAGALGVPAWTILPLVPAWRWMLTGEQSLWYPSVRLFRQHQRRAWAPVFDAVAAALANRTGRTRAGSGSSVPVRLPTDVLPVIRKAAPSTLPMPPGTQNLQTLSEVTDTFQSAAEAYRGGDLPKAEAICRQILAHAPRDAKALDLRGLIARATGRLELAIQSLGLAVQVHARDPQMHLHLAGAYLQAGNLTEAIASYQRAIELAPDVWAMHFELGGLLRSAGRREEAITSFQRAIALDANNAKAHNALAGAQLELLRWADAERTLRKAIEIKPDFMAAFNNLGQCLQFQGRIEEAAQQYRKAIALDPSCQQAVKNLQAVQALLFSPTPTTPQRPGAKGGAKGELVLGNKMSQAAKLYNDENMPEATRLAEEILAVDKDNIVALRILGVAARRSGRMDYSLELLERAVAVKSDDHALQFEIGVTLTEMHRTREALPHYVRAIELRPTFHPAYVNISAIHEQQERYEDVVEWTGKSIAVNPNCALSYYNLANALRELGRLEEAIEAYNKSLAINPNYLKAVWNLGLSHLLVGDYERGWPLFEKRIELGEVAIDDYAQPRWDGAPLTHQTLLVHGEQGIGDEVLFASCFADVIPRVGKCVIVCEPRLAAIFRRSFPQAVVYGYARRKDGAALKISEPIDAQIPAGSLPMLVRQGVADFPQRESFLVPDEKLVAFWRTRMNALGSGLKVGISWRAGGKPQERRKRMIPLEMWRDVLVTPGVHFVNLQYSDASDEVAEVERALGIQIHDWEAGDPLVDLDSFAAKIKALDLVISVGNATVHMAGAVGTAAWTLLPSVPSWRWMVRGEQSPWYQSVLLFRQTTRGDWPSVLGVVAERLRKLVGAPAVRFQSGAAKPKAAEDWYPAREVNTHLMIDSIGTSLEEAERCLAEARFDRAEELFRDVLQIAPRHFQALHGLGLVARRTGRQALAIRSFQRSLAMIDGVALHHFNYAGALAEAGRTEEAAKEYLRTLELDPAMSLARVELGRVLQDLGDHQQALAQFGKAAIQGFQSPDLMVYRGVSLASQCRIEEAIECFEQALRIEPAHLPALGALADVYLEDQQYEDAERCLRRALAVKPDVAPWHAQLGRVLWRDGRAAEGVDCLEKAVELAPQEVSMLSDLGTLYRETAQPNRAAKCFEQAIPLQPTSPELPNSLGLALADQGDFAGAISQYDRALAIKPDYASAHLNRAFALLQQGQFEQGWREYEWRWKMPGVKSWHCTRGASRAPLPVWQGESLAGKSILIVPEQGEGEEIMFASCYHEVIEQADQTIVICHPRLEQLFRRAFAKAMMVPVMRGQEAAWRPPSGQVIDFQVAAGSLPGMLRTRICHFSGQKYLAVDPAKVAHWRSRFAALGSGLCVGISWRAGDTTLDHLVRGAAIEKWRHLLDTPGINFINLQHGDVREELQALARETGLVIQHGNDADQPADLDGLAARMAALDLVISVGNANIHLAGSMSVETWALLPPVAGWQWPHLDESLPESQSRQGGPQRRENSGLLGAIPS